MSLSQSFFSYNKINNEQASGWKLIMTEDDKDEERNKYQILMINAGRGSRWTMINMQDYKDGRL